MIDEKKLIESINNLTDWMNNEAKTKSDEDAIAGLKVVLALIDEQEKSGQWIPCDDNPSENGKYLVQDDNGAMMVGTYTHEYGFIFPCHVGKIVAYRPLPSKFERNN